MWRRLSSAGFTAPRRRAEDTAWAPCQAVIVQPAARENDGEVVVKACDVDGDGGNSEVGYPATPRHQTPPKTRRGFTGKVMRHLSCARKPPESGRSASRPRSNQVTPTSVESYDAELRAPFGCLRSPFRNAKSRSSSRHAQMLRDRRSRRRDGDRNRSRAPHESRDEFREELERSKMRLEDRLSQEFALWCGSRAPPATRVPTPTRILSESPARPRASSPTELVSLPWATSQSLPPRCMVSTLRSSDQAFAAPKHDPALMLRLPRRDETPLEPSGPTVFSPWCPSPTSSQESFANGSHRDALAAPSLRSAIASQLSARSWTQENESAPYSPSRGHRSGRASVVKVPGEPSDSLPSVSTIHEGRFREAQRLASAMFALGDEDPPLRRLMVSPARSTTPSGRGNPYPS